MSDEALLEAAIINVTSRPDAPYPHQGVTLTMLIPKIGALEDVRIRVRVGRDPQATIDLTIPEYVGIGDSVPYLRQVIDSASDKGSDQMPGFEPLAQKTGE